VAAILIDLDPAGGGVDRGKTEKKRGARRERAFTLRTKRSVSPFLDSPTG
jgi:hypothetical protein